MTLVFLPNDVFYCLIPSTLSPEKGFEADTMGYLPPYADDEYSGYTAQEYGSYPYGFRQ